MLISDVQTLTTKDDASRKEVLDLSNELNAFKKQAGDFNKVSLAGAGDEELRKKSAEDLEAALPLLCREERRLDRPALWAALHELRELSDPAAPLPRRLN